MPKPKNKIDTSKTEWDLSPLLADDDDPKIQEYRASITKATDAFVAKWRPRLDYLEKPEVLKAALDEMEAWKRIPGLGFESYYFELRSCQDSIDPKIKARGSQADEFDKEIVNKLQFFNLNIAKIKPEDQNKFLNYSDMKEYKHLLERTFAAARYWLSESEEKILNLKSGVSKGRWVQMVSDFLSRQEKEVLLESGERGVQNFEQILGLINSSKKQVRDTAAKAFNEILEQHADLAEVEFNAVLENKKINDFLRGYKRPDEARHISDDIDTAVVDSLMEAVESRYDISHRYYALKARILKLPKLAYHERNLEVGEAEREYTFDQAAHLTYEVFTDLDPEFGQIFRGFQENGQIDVYTRTGKRGGAFCAGSHIATPTYILLNHTNRLRDVITLAHELGHGINNELIKQKQNALNCGTPLSTAEVASTFMEDFVTQRLIRESDDETRFSMMMSQLNDAISPIMRQVAFYRFEQEIHAEFRKQGYLSKVQIGEIFRKHMKAYMGGAVEQSDGSQNWWLYIMHFRNYFYVYSYASGMLISKSLQNSVRKDKQFIKEVKTFLSTGTSKSPKQIFVEMGIDITDKAFWNKGLNEIELLLNETEILAKKLGRIL